MSVETILSRSGGKPRKTGKGRWLVHCRAHNDKTPSVSITEKDDGRILLHCFGGCDTASVLHAIGLTIDDLFPDRLPNHHYARDKRPINAYDVLRCLAIELSIILDCAKLVSRGPLSDADKERLQLAATRFRNGLEVANVA